MGNFEEDCQQYRQRLGKSFANKNMLEFGEALRDAAPDVAFRYAAPAAVAVGSTALGGVVGLMAGTAVTANPAGGVVGGAGGAALGAVVGVEAARHVSDSYRSKSTEDRERVRSLTSSAVATAMTIASFGGVARKFRPKTA